MNTIEWTAKALKQVEKIKDKITRQRIYTEAQALADFPHCQNVKKLVNPEYSYRLRVGHIGCFSSLTAMFILSVLKR